MSIKLVICCHNRLFAEGLKGLIEDDRDLKIAGSFDGRISLNEVIKSSPDVVLSDLDTFFDLLQHSQLEDRTKTLVIYNTSQVPSMDERFADLISKGKVGILPPDTDSTLLKKAIRVVHSGELWINRKTIQSLLCRTGQTRVNLTKQEKEIAAYICQGFRNKEIAQKLEISEQTVKSHCNRIYKKFGVTDRLQLALALVHDKEWK